MTRTMRKIKALATGAGIALALALALPAGANAANESLSSTFSLQPQSGSFLNNGFKSANWKVENTVSVPAGEPQILPSKVIDIGNPPQDQMRFNPGNMPVCGNEIGPGNVGVPVDVVVARCPNSVLGNGTAQFAFAQIPTTLLDGVVVAFNGGTRNGNALVKVYAYSYATNVGIYTEGVLNSAGRLKFDIPQLTADSSVTTLDLAFPGNRQVLSGIDPSGQDVILPKGQKADYVQAKCSNGQFPWDTKFTLGTRATDGTPTSPDTFVMDSGSEACTGVTGKAKINKVKVKGPSKIKRGKKATYKVTIKNTGVVTGNGRQAQGVRQGHQLQHLGRQDRRRQDPHGQGQGQAQEEGQGQGEVQGDLEERRQARPSTRRSRSGDPYLPTGIRPPTGTERGGHRAARFFGRRPPGRLAKVPPGQPVVWRHPDSREPLDIPKHAFRG